MARTSSFCRPPHVRFFDLECALHGTVSSSEVEQFDGSVLPRGCQHCHWEALHTAPKSSEAHILASGRKRAEDLNRLLVGSGITPRFKGCSFETYRTAGGCDGMPKALHACRDYVDQFPDNYAAGRSLVLTGNVGNGKTHLACSIVQAVIRKHGAQAVIVTAAEIIRVFKGAMDRGAEYSDRDVLDELAAFDLLVIDEIGAQSGSAYELSVLHEVIDRRYQFVLPTVVVSNVAAAELARYIGDRGLDRLRQGAGQAVGFNWVSARGAV
ncbi:ATP-binding protein [Pseudomonas sp. COR58]|uniref:ATP-binding protein n=1 Tax=Pseudomonas ekonensis TaxID=2842353 RepID=A0ABS6PGT4_9PSED|nr:ATP-binding protein [Pseudomonas ekonensis]MBV4459191.1 ATP-binding protein [Pseudomonas ekonensis]